MLGRGAAADTEGLFRRPLERFVAAEATPEAAALALSVAPNPSAGPAALRFVLADAAAVRVTILDALGRTVLTLDRALAAGPQALPLDASRLAPGRYVARLIAGGAQSSSRFTVAR